MEKDLKKSSELLGKLQQEAEEDKAEMLKLAEQVVDCTAFKKRQKYFERAMEHFEKRLVMEEETTRNFGQFIVRYLPISYMIQLAEHMALCGHSGALKSLKAFLDQQAETEIKPIKTRKYNFVTDIEGYKEKLMKRFEEVRRLVEK